HHRALEALATRAEEAEEWSSALEWWRRRAALDQLDSRVAVRLIGALAACGNRAAALRHASDHQRLLADELGVGPDPAVAAAADQLRAQPRPAGAAGGGQVEPVIAEPAAALAPSLQPRRTQRRRIAILAAAAALAAVAVSGIVFASRGAPPAAE